MKYFFHTRAFWVTAAIVLIIVVLLGVFGVLFGRAPAPITASVTRGDVEEIISVSGVVDSTSAAHLAFPVSDIVTSVAVREGDHVEEGEVLATLSLGTLRARERDALAGLSIAKADRDELLSGPTEAAREVTKSTVDIATENLKRTIAEQDELVKNARRTLYSTGLEAVPGDPGDSATPPTISGTYTCEEPMTYMLDMYSSGANSGYSYRLIYNGSSRTQSAYTTSAQPLGDCGLLIRFDADSHYSNSSWTIEVPNTRSSSYAANLNAYELAEKTRTNEIEAAEQALLLAQNEATFENASPRAEALVRANAAVLRAEADLASVRSQIADRTLRAPFAGTITDVEIILGEVSGTGAVVTLVSDAAFELTVRIPEIDITKIAEGQTAHVVFDARTSDTIDSEVEFVSPLATLIDGVAYYEARLAFGEPPAWLRSGLNADVDIVVASAQDTLRIPLRFVFEDDRGPFVYRFDDGVLTDTPITITFRGNDGYVAIEGLAEGEHVAVPQTTTEE